MGKSFKPYTPITDSFADEDLLSFRKESKKLQDDLTTILEKIQNKPMSFKDLSGPLKGFKKAKFGPGKSFRVIYSVDQRDRTVRYLIIGHRDGIYERLAARQASYNY